MTSRKKAQKAQAKTGTTEHDDAGAHETDDPAAIALTLCLLRFFAAMPLS